MQSKAKTVKIVLSIVAIAAAGVILYIQFKPAPIEEPTPATPTKTASTDTEKPRPNAPRRAEEPDFQRQGGGILAPGGDK